MIFEALTGRHPFTGSAMRIITHKVARDPAPLGSLVDGVPPDLELLCMELLAREPQRRATGEEVLRRLAAPAASESGWFVAPPDAAPPAHFVGRQRELARLHHAFDRVREAGRTCPDRTRPRCKPRCCGPADTELLIRVFPAMRQTLLKLSAQGPVVLCMDDLQWADGDSLLLLRDLLEGEGAPPMLVLVTWRPDGREDGSAPQELLPTGSEVMNLTQMPPGDAVDLARVLVEISCG